VRVDEVGEFGLLARVLPSLPQTDAVLVPPGDDAAVLRVPGAVVASTDVLVDGVHLRRDWFSPVDVGHKAAAVNMADIAAMGARSLALLVGLVLPPDTEVGWVEGFTTGLAEATAAQGVAVVGGDVVAGTVLTVAVTALGTPVGPLVLRSGAQAGDVVAVRGRLGWAAAGLAVLQRGFRSPRALVDAQRRPEPPYEAGPQAAAAGASAMIDISDGLLSDLGHLAQASGVRIVVDAAKVPVDDPVAAMAAGFGLDPLRWVLTGGEDHALAASFPAASALPPGWVEVGQVQEGEGVELVGATIDGSGGFAHFQVSE
jgi:thiamine-monophosphate kinase